MNEVCIYCGQPSVLLCDFVLGFTDPDGDGLFSFSGGHSLLRCDAPLCPAHADQKAVIHASGKKGFTDTVDHCIGHQDGESFAPITTEKAHSARYRHRCGAVPLRLVPA